MQELKLTGMKTKDGLMSDKPWSDFNQMMLDFEIDALYKINKQKEDYIRAILESFFNVHCPNNQVLLADESAMVKVQSVIKAYKITLAESEPNIEASEDMKSMSMVSNLMGVLFTKDSKNYLLTVDNKVYPVDVNGKVDFSTYRILCDISEV